MFLNVHYIKLSMISAWLYETFFEYPGDYEKYSITLSIRFSLVLPVFGKKHRNFSVSPKIFPVDTLKNDEISLLLL